MIPVLERLLQDAAEKEDILSKISPDFIKQISIPSWFTITGIVVGGAAGAMGKWRMAAYGFGIAVAPEFWEFFWNVTQTPTAREGGTDLNQDFYKFFYDALPDFLAVGGAYLIFFGIRKYAEYKHHQNRRMDYHDHDY